MFILIMDEQLLNKALALRKWFQKYEYKGIDPFQLDEKLFKANIPFISVIRKAVKPFHVLIPNKAFSSLPKIMYPKAIGLIISGNCLLYNRVDVITQKEILQENKLLFDFLKQTKSNDFQEYCWGWPFVWGQSPRYPLNTALVCVTGPILHALLDYYQLLDSFSGSENKSELKNNDNQNEIKKLKKELKSIMASAIDFMLEQNKYYEGSDGICFYYSRLDKHKAISGNIIAGAFFARYGIYFKKKEFVDFAKKCILFTLNHQEKDGSWKYIVDAGEKENKIDNRHTGYVIEALLIIHFLFAQQKEKQVGKKVMDNIVEKDIIKLAIDKGMQFYKRNLFEGFIPKWSVDKTFPVDCHDVAQAIITLQTAGEKEFARQIFDFAVQKMSNGNDEFYYKYFENGKVNNTVFFRWNQAWMYLAIVKMVD